jgi:hypothetical protein
MIYEDATSKLNTQIEQMVSSIGKKDTDGLRSLFSENALDNIANFDETAELLFKFVQGTIHTTEKTSYNLSTSSDYGKRTARMHSKYIISTEKEKYRFFFVYCPEDDVNPENIGFYTIRVVRLNEEKDFFAYWPEMEIPGITVLSKVQN